MIELYIILSEFHLRCQDLRCYKYIACFGKWKGILQDLPFTVENIDHLTK